MDIKLVILLAVAIAIIFLMMNEMSTLREDIDKKMSELNNRIIKYNEDTKTSFKKEAKDMSAKFKAYSTDMVKELRTMNNIENQAITHMSDQFAEGDSIDRFGLPHLSDINVRQNMMLNERHAVIVSNDRTNSKSSRTGENDGRNENRNDNEADNEEEYYMSPASDDFRLREDGELLPSAQEGTRTEESEESDVSDSEEDDVEEDDGDNSEEDGDEDDEEDEDDDEDDDEVEEDVEEEEDDEDEDEVEDEVEEDAEEEEDEVEDDSSSQKKLETYKKIRASMEDDEDDLSSENITFGSARKGGQITVKGISKRKGNDNLSIATEDDDFRLKSISRYSKKDLVNIASERGVKVSERSNKTVIYNKIKENL